MTFADQVQVIVHRPGWTQQRLSAEIGVGQSTISKWCNGILPDRANEQRLYELARSLEADAGPTALEGQGAPTQSRRKTYLREWRKYRGLTLEQLSARLDDMAPSNLSMLERGERGYTQDTLERIAGALETDVTSLLASNPTDGPRARTDRTGLVRFEWSGHLTPAAAAKVASIIADDTADRAFHWQPTEVSA